MKTNGGQSNESDLSESEMTKTTTVADVHESNRTKTTRDEGKHKKRWK